MTKQVYRYNQSTSNKLTILLISLVFLVFGFIVPSAIHSPVIAQAQTSNYYTITFRADTSTSTLLVAKGSSIDFSGVTKYVRYNNVDYSISGWTSDVVVYPWDSEYIKGYQYMTIDTTSYIPTADTILNAVLTESNNIGLGDINTTEYSYFDRLFDKADKWFTESSLGQSVTNFFTGIKWWSIIALCAVGALIIMLILAVGVNKFRN